MLKHWLFFLIFLWELPLSRPEPLLGQGYNTPQTRTYGLPMQCGGIYLPKNIVCKCITEDDMKMNEDNFLITFLVSN